MYTVEKLQELLNLETGETVQFATLCSWIDKLTVEVCRQYGVPEQWVVDAEDSREMDLPSDHLETVAVVDANNWPVKDYEVTDYGKISFPRAGEYTVYYLKLPLPIAVNAEAVPPVHDIFHPYYIDGLLYHYWDCESEGDSQEKAHASDHYMKFRDAVNKCARMLRGRSYPIEQIEIPKPLIGR